MSAWFSRIMHIKVTCVTKLSAVLKHVFMGVEREKWNHNAIL